MTLAPAQLQPVPLPAPRAPVTVRAATMADFAFIDALQGSHTKQVGWMPKAQLEGKLNLGHVIVAEDEAKQAVGFIIGNDQYFKRDDCGIIYQLCIAPAARRSLIGAVLVKAMFERAAWGCKLFCCWCAQDIEANHFWESLGFIPLAYRAGSQKKGRVHIFWQKRIREGDTTTPWWFPAKTDGGALREGRLVLPIPPGLSWSDQLPLLRPEPIKPDPASPAHAHKKLVPGMKAKPQVPTRGRPHVQAGPPSAAQVSQQFPPHQATAEAKPTRQKHKCHPRHIALARELRDRYLEEVNSDPALLLPRAAKYDVVRASPAGPEPAIALKALPAAA